MPKKVKKVAAIRATKIKPKTKKVMPVAKPKPTLAKPSLTKPTSTKPTVAKPALKSSKLKSSKKVVAKLRPAKAKLLKRGLVVRKVKKDAKRVIKPDAPMRPLTQEMLELRRRLVSMLADMRRDIDHEVRGASERDLAHINDTSDMALDSAEGDLSLRIAESETVEATEIQRAIEKIDTGTYGLCEMCNTQINSERLKFLPYVTHCIKCQELAELRRREDSDELEDLAETSEMDSENN